MNEVCNVPCVASFFLKMEINTTYKQITDKTTEDRVVNLNMVEVSIYDLS